MEAMGLLHNASEILLTVPAEPRFNALGTRHTVVMGLLPSSSEILCIEVAGIVVKSKSSTGKPGRASSISRAIRIGWSLLTGEATIAYEPPTRFVPPKDPSPSGRGFLSCPATRAFFGNSTYQIKSPFSLQLRCEEREGNIVVRAVYPFTSLTEAKVQEFVTIEPQSTWREPKVIALQMPSPYVFYSDVPVTMAQFHPALVNSSSTGWQLIQGQFDIYRWQRPLNWAVEWNFENGDLIVRAGEPIYFVRFMAPSGSAFESVELVKLPVTEDLDDRLKMTRGITALRRGTHSLFERAGDMRRGKVLVKMENK